MRTARVRAARRHNGGERLINDSMNFETSQLTIKNPRTFDGGENFFALMAVAMTQEKNFQLRSLLSESFSHFVGSRLRQSTNESFASRQDAVANLCKIPLLSGFLLFQQRSV
jgi:hypothetical protein